MESGSMRSFRMSLRTLRASEKPLVNAGINPRKLNLPRHTPCIALLTHCTLSKRSDSASH